MKETDERTGLKEREKNWMARMLFNVANSMDCLKWLGSEGKNLF